MLSEQFELYHNWLLESCGLVLYEGHTFWPRGSVSHSEDGGGAMFCVSERGFSVKKQKDDSNQSHDHDHNYAQNPS